MSSENLVKMANQIAHYFDSEPDRALAVQGCGSICRVSGRRMMRLRAGGMERGPCGGGA